MPDEFQPSLLGTEIAFQNEGKGMITNETATDIYIESKFFTGWMSKPEFWASLGTEE